MHIQKIKAILLSLVPIISAISLSVSGVLLTSSSSVYAQPKNTVVSIGALDFPDRYFRHKNFLGYLEPISGELDKKDATFKLIPGLANRNCISFESVNFPGQFLRHENFKLKLVRRINQQLFNQDATFCIVQGLSGRASSFESINFPGYYIRHQNFELRVDPSDGSDLFRKDATFNITTPLYR
jgi:Alpha-L-arabinofuranosidase B (ABFB) domain